MVSLSTGLKPMIFDEKSVIIWLGLFDFKHWFISNTGDLKCMSGMTLILLRPLKALRESLAKCIEQNQIVNV